jgi:3-hydroxyacyl-[acyl-carrier-protein] dehydratase
MKLIDDFFSTSLVEKAVNIYNFRVILNSAHPIYGAHFPHNPITPGVCLLQIAKEIYQRHICTDDTEKIISSIRNIKFLRPINPLENEEIIYKMKSEQIENSTYLDIEIFDKTQHTIFTKMKIKLS